MTAKQIQEQINSVLNIEAEPKQTAPLIAALWEIAKQLAILNEQKYGTGVQTHHSNN